MSGNPNHSAHTSQSGSWDTPNSLVLFKRGVTWGDFWYRTSPLTGVAIEPSEYAPHLAEKYGWKQIEPQHGVSAWLKNGTYDREPSEKGKNEVIDENEHSEGQSDEESTLLSSVLTSPRIVPCKGKPVMKHLCRQIRENMLSFTLPKLKTRTNIIKTDGVFRGLLLGTFTRRGHGMMDVSRKHQALLPLLHELASLRTDYTPCASVYLGSSPYLPLHRDQHSFSHNDIVCTRKHTGGRLFVETKGGRSGVPNSRRACCWESDVCKA
eukprot:4633283-Amphidinium_carterae.2